MVIETTEKNNAYWLSVVVGRVGNSHSNKLLSKYAKIDTGADVVALPAEYAVQWLGFDEKSLRSSFDYMAQAIANLRSAGGDDDAVRQGVRSLGLHPKMPKDATADVCQTASGLGPAIRVQDVSIEIRNKGQRLAVSLPFAAVVQGKTCLLGMSFLKEFNLLRCTLTRRLMLTRNKPPLIYAFARRCKLEVSTKSCLGVPEEFEVRSMGGDGASTCKNGRLESWFMVSEAEAEMVEQRADGYFGRKSLCVHRLDEEQLHLFSGDCSSSK